MYGFTSAIGFIGFIIAFFVVFLLIRFKHLHSHWSVDNLENRPQKFHRHVVPRIGGVAIFAGFFFALGVSVWAEHVEPWGFELLFVCSLPIFLGGLIEDLTKQVGALTRLTLSFVAAGLGVFLLGGRLIHSGMPAVDMLLLNYPVISLFLTFLAVGGVINAMNIIDGYNGLCGMVALMIFVALGYVCYQVDDYVLLTICLAAIGATLGFFVWNFPRGLIFSGDGGAYFMGFLIAEISVLLIARHPDVSAFVPLLLVAYPVFEMLFSIYRRKFLLNKAVDSPDAMHLHQMVYKRLVRWKIGSGDPQHLIQRNSLTSPYLWALNLLTVVPAMLFWDQPLLLVLSGGMFMVCYVSFYRMIVKLHCPKWMVLRNRSKHECATQASRVL